jgi:hypothetical protein
VRKYVTEMLDEINEDPRKAVLFKDDVALRILLQHAFMPELKFVLPEGTPPFKPDKAPIGMSSANFSGEMRKLYIFTKQRELSTVRREQLFIQLLENVHPTEAALLIAVKDQTLTKMYKKITLNLLIDAGLLPQELKKANEPTRPKKS